VAINGDTDYDQTKLRELGAHVVHRKINLGGNANIALGFEYFQSANCLWILSDDDPIAEHCISEIFDAMNNFDSPDLIKGTRVGETRLHHFDELGDPFFELEGSLVSLISSTVYRGGAFSNSMEVALQSTHTYFPHVVLMLSGL